MWNRTCNPNGGAGHSVELDLHMEHLNRNFKDYLNTFEANMATKCCNTAKTDVEKSHRMGCSFIVTYSTP